MEQHKNSLMSKKSVISQLATKLDRSNFMTFPTLFNFDGEGAWFFMDDLDRKSVLEVDGGIGGGDMNLSTRI